MFSYNNTAWGNRSDHNIKFCGPLINKVEKFNYLGLIVQKSGGIVEDVASKIGCG